MRLVTDSGTSENGSRESGIDQRYNVGAFNVKPKSVASTSIVHVGQMHDDQ